MSHGERVAGRRFYGIAGLTVQVESDLPIVDTTFEPKFGVFEVGGPGPDTIVVRHHFGLPEVDEGDLGAEVYRRSPWAIFRSANQFTYFLSGPVDDEPECVVFADSDHSTMEIFNGKQREESFREGGLSALTMLTTDQVLLARTFAERQACFVHSCGVIVDGRGLLFVGHSEAGKSTMMTMFASASEPLCDDRNIVRIWPDEVRVYGCWSHGEVPIVSAASAPLGALLFLQKATTNRIVRLTRSDQILHHLLPCVIKPLATADWWEKTLDVAEHVTRGVPCYIVEFERSGAVVGLLRDLLAKRDARR
jgi:hypothetical protein